MHCSFVFLFFACNSICDDLILSLLYFSRRHLSYSALFFHYVTDVEVPDFKVGTDNLTPDFKAKSPLGRVPVLDTPNGAICESNAISRFLGRIKRDTKIYGETFFESSQVDMWMDFCANNIELPATVWTYPVLGYLPYNAPVVAKAKTDLAKALTVLDNHLLQNSYLVGHQVTLADITIVSALVYPFKFVCDPAYRKNFPNVLRWFECCVNQPNFVSVIGTVVLAEKELVPIGGAPVAAAAGGAAKADKPKADKPKKEAVPKVEKPKEEKKPKKKDDDDDDDEPLVPVEKKEDHPFKIMDQTAKSTFVMDTWKKTYSNAEDYKVAMQYFYDNFDAEGWSIFRGDYKYNEESKVLFMTSNLIAGFIQRTEEIRKWLFGTMTIRGVEGPGTMKVTCYYLIRGQSIEPLLKCNDDAECYEWTKLAVPISDADKQQLYDYWCSEGPLDGEPCLDSRCYK